MFVFVISRALVIVVRNADAMSHRYTGSSAMKTDPGTLRGRIVDGITAAERFLEQTLRDPYDFGLASVKLLDLTPHIFYRAAEQSRTRRICFWANITRVASRHFQS